MKSLKMKINRNFVSKYLIIFNLIIHINQLLDSIAQQRIFHRRVHSDPTWSLPKDSIGLNRLHVTSPLPISMCSENQIKAVVNIPNISYFQSDEDGSYGSSYDSRVDLIDPNKRTKLSPEKLTDPENDNHQSISSQITLIDTQNNDSDDHHVSSMINHDEKIPSIKIISPMKQSRTELVDDCPIRSNLFSKRN